MHPQQQPSSIIVETGPSAPTTVPSHTHCAKVDMNGNGITTIDFGHQHTVVGGAAQPTSDGHMHGLTQSMCRHNPQRSWGKAGCSSCGKR